MAILAILLVLGGVGLLLWVVTAEVAQQGGQPWLTRAARSVNVARDRLLVKARVRAHTAASRIRAGATGTAARVRGTTAGLRDRPRTGPRSVLGGDPGGTKPLPIAPGLTTAPGLQQQRRRVRFEQSFDLTATGPQPDRSPAFATQPVERRAASRILGVVWLVVLVAVAAAAIAAVFWGAGTFLVKAINSYFNS